MFFAEAHLAAALVKQARTQEQGRQLLEAVKAGGRNLSSQTDSQMLFNGCSKGFLMVLNGAMYGFLGRESGAVPHFPSCSVAELSAAYQRSVLRLEAS